jgi:hypothetical protein
MIKTAFAAWSALNVKAWLLSLFGRGDLRENFQI